MFGRIFGKTITETQGELRGFDSFELRLGDMMRGERATMGKSLLDVQRELRIQASYIAAIEDCDPSAFETPGFIAGYVRSYARYLGMDPDDTFVHFCVESGFTGVHGKSGNTLTEGRRDAAVAAPAVRAGRSDVIGRSQGPFVPQSASLFAGIEPGALGSVLVLLALVGGIGFGGWSVLQEIQRVQVSPVDEAPDMVAQITDPLAGAIIEQPVTAETAGVIAPSIDALDRLYRPQALDVPVLVARDAPISTIAPGTLGALAGLAPSPSTQVASVESVDISGIIPQVMEAAQDKLILFAVRPAWIRVSSADGSVLFEKILDAGETYAVPQTETPALLHAGNSGSVYFRLNGETFGPAGVGTAVARGVSLGVDPVRATYQVADATADRDLATIVAQLVLPAGDAPQN
jgi:cytoskeleton protein RodZ